MPVDPRIPLQAVGFEYQQTHPLEMYSRAAALKNALREGQLQEQQISANDLKLKQAQQDQQDQQVFRTVLAQTNGDYEKAAPLLAGKVSPKLQQELNKAILDHQKSVGEMDKTKLENQAKRDEIVANGLISVAEAPPEAKPSVYGSFRQSAIKSGVAKETDIPPQYDEGWVLTHRFLSTPVNQHNTAALNAKTNADKAKMEADTLKSKQAQEAFAQVAARLGSATSPAETQAILAKLPVEIAQQFAGKTPEQARQMGLTAEQQTQAAQAQTNAESTKTYRDEQLKLQRAAHELQAKKFSLEFGGDAVKGWAATLAENPDAASSVPPVIRSQVQQQFTQQTGLPFPKALSGEALTQERAARNAMDNIQFIQDAIKNPEIQARLGSIMGRLGNAEQDVGATVGLSPEAARHAQELRTRMRYFVFQEGKSLMGGRPAQVLIKQLEAASPNTKMSPEMISGAIDAARGSAVSALDNADRQRFGGKMRTREQRGITSGGESNGGWKVIKVE